MVLAGRPSFIPRRIIQLIIDRVIHLIELPFPDQLLRFMTICVLCMFPFVGDVPLLFEYL
jgi:hypothetical protein